MDRVILTLMIYSYISFFHQWNEFLLTIIWLWRKEMNGIGFNYLECGGENVKQQKWECRWWLYEKDIYRTDRWLCGSNRVRMRKGKLILPLHLQILWIHFLQEMKYGFQNPLSCYSLLNRFWWWCIVLNL